METGFYYLQSRYYDPALGRFLNADSYASTGQGFLGYNMFAYCNNNPVKYMDVDGEKLELAIAMYRLAIDGESGEYDFTNDMTIGSMLKKHLYESSCFSAAIASCLPELPFETPYSAEDTSIEPYKYSTPADNELKYSVGYATLSVEVLECKETAYYIEYRIHYTLTDIYNFEYWKSGHSFWMRRINNIGGWFPQTIGTISPYRWSISGYYSYYVHKDTPRPSGGRPWRKELA